MKAYDVLLVAAELLNQNDVVKEIEIFKQKYEKNEQIDGFSDDILLKVRKLIAHLNLVVEKIASEHIVMKAKDEVASDNDFRIDFGLLNNSAHEIIRVVDGLTFSEVEFDVYTSHITVPLRGRRYIIEYKYRPSAIDDIDEDVNLPIYITHRVVSFGIVSDVLFTRNVFDEAKLWNDKFLESLRLVRYQSRERLFG